MGKPGCEEAEEACVFSAFRASVLVCTWAAESLGWAEMLDFKFCGSRAAGLQITLCIEKE